MVLLLLPPLTSQGRRSMLGQGAALTLAAPTHPHHPYTAAKNGMGEVGGISASSAGKAFGVLAALGTLAFGELSSTRPCCAWSCTAGGRCLVPAAEATQSSHLAHPPPSPPRLFPHPAAYNFAMVRAQHHNTGVPLRHALLRWLSGWSQPEAMPQAVFLPFPSCRCCLRSRTRCGSRPTRPRQ